MIAARAALVARHGPLTLSWSDDDDDLSLFPTMCGLVVGVSTVSSHQPKLKGPAELKTVILL